MRQDILNLINQQNFEEWEFTLDQNTKIITFKSFPIATGDFKEGVEKLIGAMWALRFENFENKENKA